jgi:hypothetical protein
MFASERGTPLDRSDLRRTFARIAKTAGLDVALAYEASARARAS